MSGVLGDLAHDQEVGGEPHGAEDRQLLAKALVVGRTAPSAFSPPSVEALQRQAFQAIRRALAARKRERGKERPPVAEIQRAGFGHARRFCERVRHVPEQCTKLGRRGQTPLRRLGLRHLGDLLPATDCHPEHVQVPVSAAGHDDVGVRDGAHSIWWRAAAARTHEEITHCRRRHAGPQQRLDHGRILAEEEHAARVGIQTAERVVPSARAIAPAARDDPAEALIARAIAREQDESSALVPERARPVARAKLHAGDRLDTLKPGRVVESHLTVQVLHVRQGERRESGRGGAQDQLLDRGGAVACGELALHMEWDGHPGGLSYNG